jgi:hypothetical protein
MLVAFHVFFNTGVAGKQFASGSNEAANHDKSLGAKKLSKNIRRIAQKYGLVNFWIWA